MQQEGALSKKPFLVKQEDGRIIGIEIEGLDTTKPVIFALSPDQEYHNGPIFSAILEYLASCGVVVCVMLGDYLRRFTFQLEQGKLTIDAEIEHAVEEFNHDWQDVNLHGSRNKLIVAEMKAKEKFGFFGWKYWIAAENEYSAKTASILPDVRRIYEEREGFYNAINEATESFFSVFCEKNRNNPRFMRLLKWGIESGQGANDREEGDSGVFFVKQIIQSYLFEECAVFLVWKSLKFTQMIYPINYHGNGKGTTNQKVFNCITSIFQRLYPDQDPNKGMRLLNIKITQTSPKKKLDASLHPSLKYTTKPRRLFPDEPSLEASTTPSEMAVKNEKLQMDVEQLTKEKSEHQAKNSQQEITIQKLSEETTRLQMKADQLAKEKAELQARDAEQKIQIQTLTEQNIEYQRDVSVQSEVGVMNAGLHRILQQLAEQNASLQTVVSQQALIIEKLTDDNVDLKEVVSQQATKLEELTGQMNEMQIWQAKQANMTEVWAFAAAQQAIILRGQASNILSPDWSNPPRKKTSDDSPIGVDSVKRIAEEVILKKQEMSPASLTPPSSFWRSNSPPNKTRDDSPLGVDPVQGVAQDARAKEQ